MLITTVNLKKNKYKKKHRYDAVHLSDACYEGEMEIKSIDERRGREEEKERECRRKGKQRKEEEEEDEWGSIGGRGKERGRVGV